jgi:PEP-CTERM motif
MKTATSMLTLLALGMGSGGAFAATTAPWTGTANYKVAPGASGIDEDIVGPFSTYDLAANSPVLIESIGGANVLAPLVGDQFSGYYQSFVSAHQLGGIGVANPNLNTTGVGGGYEVTVAANFVEQITLVGGSTSQFNITGGNLQFYFDTTPDYKYSTDSGFTDGASILTGTIVGGSGTILGGVFGVTTLDVRVDSYNATVFEPDTIVAGSSIFTLQLNPNGVSSSGISSVQGNAYNSGADVLLMADGNFALAVPEASSYMMMLTGLGILGFMAARRRNIFS